MRATIKLEVPTRGYGDARVELLIGQDPMGDLERPVEVTINGQRFVAEVGGYANDGSMARLTLYAVAEESQT